MSLNLGKNLPGSRFIPGFGGGYVSSNSNDVTNRTSAHVVAATVPRKRLKSRIDSSFFLNSSNNVTNQTFMPAAAASISNKSLIFPFLLILLFQVCVIVGHYFILSISREHF